MVNLNRRRFLKNAIGLGIISALRPAPAVPLDVEKQHVITFERDGIHHIIRRVNSIICSHQFELICQQTIVKINYELRGFLDELMHRNELRYWSFYMSPTNDILHLTITPFDSAEPIVLDFKLD